jgi:hypothetical protein
MAVRVPLALVPVGEGLFNLAFERKPPNHGLRENQLAVRDHVELTVLARGQLRIFLEA